MQCRSSTQKNVKMLWQSEKGVLSGSDIYFYTPSQMAKEQLFYFTSVGHCFCDMNYCVDRNDDYGNYLLLLVKQGRLHICAEGEDFIVKSGEMAFINCHFPHKYEALGICEFLWVHFDGANTSQFYERLLKYFGGHHFFALEDTTQVEKRFREILTICRYGTAVLELDDSMRIYGLLIEIYKGISGNGRRTDSVGDWLIDEALKFIEEHFREELSVKTIAQHIGLSESHFSRKFRRLMNSSPKEYVIRRRLTEAKGLLKTSSYTISEIGFMVGFHSESHFVNTFTLHNGISPGRFREYPI